MSIRLEMLFVQCPLIKAWFFTFKSFFPLLSVSHSVSVVYPYLRFTGHERLSHYLTHFSTVFREPGKDSTQKSYCNISAVSDVVNLVKFDFKCWCWLQAHKVPTWTSIIVDGGGRENKTFAHCVVCIITCHI